MKAHQISIALLSAMLLLGSPLIAQADEIWNFFGPQAPFPNAPSNFVTIGTQGATTSVTNADGFTVGLTPFGSFDLSVPATLTGENGGAGSNEQGAGVCTTLCPPAAGVRHDWHIDGTDTLRINLAPGFTNWTVRIASLDPGTESTNVYAGSISPANLIGTVVRDANPDFSALAIPNADDGMPIFVTAVGSTDTIVYGLTASPVPEPSTLLLLGSGLAGISGFTWRRKRK